LSELPVALDAMGGDHGLGPNIEGAALAARADGAHVILVGDEAAMLAELVRCSARDLLGGPLTMRHAPDVVEMDEKPATAARRKKDSSMRRAADLVQAGEACGVLSAGNSGAMMATALLVFGRITGTARPAIGTMLPSSTGRLAHLVDAGANVDCEPFHLAQWAVLASTYLERTYGIERPRVAVVSNGEEEAKGTDLTRATVALLKAVPSINLVGYVEGSFLNSGMVDVFVTDGFTGNVMLMRGVGVFRFMLSELNKGYATGSLAEKLGGALSRPMFERLRQRLDPREFAAAPLLGLARPAFIAHGTSDAYTIRRGIGAVRTYARNDLLAHMRAAIAASLPFLEPPGDKSRSVSASTSS
jgi:glycerol-3-phosphate acyltransferase PlsX